MVEVDEKLIQNYEEYKKTMNSIKALEAAIPNTTVVSVNKDDNSITYVVKKKLINDDKNN